jgi:hypothetical protein
VPTELPLTNPKRDLFAELYVAGLFADAGWGVYFPKRDEGFDFIAVKNVSSTFIVRPVQVKGKYPQKSKKDKIAYGYAGELTALHEDMVLAIPFFVHTKEAAPKMTAFMPRIQIRAHTTIPNWYTSSPCSFKNDEPHARRDFQKFFDAAGMELMENSNFPQETIGASDGGFEPAQRSFKSVKSAIGGNRRLEMT